MGKHEKQTWQKTQDAETAGYDPKPWRGLQIHGQNTARHEFVKFCLCWVLDQRGREWDTEVQMNDGRVDVFDYGPEDGKPVVYEVETDVTPARKTEKLNQYCKGPVRDVYVLDPADVPGEFAAAIEYIGSQVVIG